MNGRLVFRNYVLGCSENSTVERSLINIEQQRVVRQYAYKTLMWLHGCEVHIEKFNCKNQLFIIIKEAHITQADISAKNYFICVGEIIKSLEIFDG